MAKFANVTAGLLPTEVASAPKIRPPKQSLEVICEVCGGQVGFMRAGKDVSSPCRHCTTFFGLAHWNGCTNDSPEQAAEKLARIREAGWFMILRRGRFGSSGGEVEVEPGDVFKCGRIGDEARRTTPEACSSERTKALFTVSVNLAGVDLIQYTHEVAPIGFLTVMDLRRRGELVESFLSKDDQEGHLVPTPELRKEIYETFGRLVNA